MIAFHRYQICPEFDVWKRRYRENTREPNIDLAFLRPPYIFPMAWIDFQSQSPLKIHLDKLVLRITPSLLNRFLRFQRRCNLLIQTFPTMYDTTRFSKEISKEEQVNKNMGSSSSRPPEQVLKRE